MTRVMLDALMTGGIPVGTKLAAWYPYDGRNTEGPPHAYQVVGIDNTGDHPNLPILDVENGAASDQQAPAWVDNNSSGYPTIYRSAAYVPTLFQHMQGIGHTWYLWVAKWTNTVPVSDPLFAGIPANCRIIGQQYASLQAYDESLIFDDAWFPVVGSEPAPSPGRTGTYVVQSGDTLSSIAARYGIANWETLYQANRTTIGDNPNLIFPGQILLIPQDRGTYYIVRSGDSLSAIAAKFGLPNWEELYALNRGVVGSNPNAIYPGQQLLIP